MILSPKLHEPHIGCYRQLRYDVCTGEQPGRTHKYTDLFNTRASHFIISNIKDSHEKKYKNTLLGKTISA